MAKSIIDDPSQWTRKPKDLFDDKVKRSLDARGWGSSDDSVDPDNPFRNSVAQQQILREHRYMRDQLAAIERRTASSSSLLGTDVNSIANRALINVSER